MARLPLVLTALFYCSFSRLHTPGRVIFWDQIVPLLSESSSSEESDLLKRMTTPTKPQPLFARLVAKIGQTLDCRRIVWRHRGDNPLPLYQGVVPVETLEGWLTLYWDLADMQAFAPYRKQAATDTGVATTDGASQLSLQDAFVAALAQAKHDTFRLRLATADDVPVIDRLVLGLAEFEGEPESYKLSKEQLKHDGFADRPMYYCILMDDKAKEDYSCAMALCYVACDLSGGRFLYLEDLFVEEAYRGKGGGKLVMSTLALVAQSLQCTKAVWVCSIPLFFSLSSPALSSLPFCVLTLAFLSLSLHLYLPHTLSHVLPSSAPSFSLPASLLLCLS